MIDRKYNIARVTRSSNNELLKATNVGFSVRV